MTERTNINCCSTNKAALAAEEQQRDVGAGENCMNSFRSKRLAGAVLALADCAMKPVAMVCKHSGDASKMKNLTAWLPKMELNMAGFTTRN